MKTTSPPHAAAVLILGVFCLSGTQSAWPSDVFRNGAFCGQVIDAASGKPVADATVALRDRRNKVVAWTKTDARGHYRLGASVSLLGLPVKPRHGVMADIGRGFVQIVQLPVKAVGAAAGTTIDAIKSLDPVSAVKSAAVGTLAGSGAPIAVVASGLENAVGSAGQQKARTAAAQVIVNGVPTPAKPKDAPDAGEVAIAISAPQYKTFRGIAGSYWMEPSEAVADPEKKYGAQVWLDKVRLAPAGSGGDSDTQDQSIRLTKPTVDAALAPAGSTVKITVEVEAPLEPAVGLRVVAREKKTRRMTELTPQGNGVYAGSMPLDAKMSVGDTVISVAALRASPIDVSLKPEKNSDALLAYAARLDSLDAGKPYAFDPRIMASENRLDLEMTVLDPALESPSAAPSSSAIPGPLPAAPAAPDSGSAHPAPIAEPPSK